MEQAQYQQILASLEGLTAAQIDALLQTLRERQDADGVQRLIMARMAQEGCCPRCLMRCGLLIGEDLHG